MHYLHRASIPDGCTTWCLVLSRLFTHKRQCLHNGSHNFSGERQLSDKTISWDDFEKVDIRSGTIIDVQPFPEARKPAFKLKIDFGDKIGVKRSSAQITRHYSPETLLGRQVLAVVNFPPRQIGPFMSEVLTLGLPDENGDVVLAAIDKPVPNGGKLF